MEKAKIIRISRGNVAPITLRIVLSLIIFLICNMLIVYLPKALAIVSMVFTAPLLPLIWTLRDVIEINMNKKIIHEYIWILGIKWGMPKSFNRLEYIFINSTKMNQTMNNNVNIYNPAFKILSEYCNVYFEVESSKLFSSFFVNNFEHL